MNISDADKSLLTKYTQVAKKIIYNPERVKVLAKMMDHPEGLPQVVLTVMGGIEHLKPVPPNIRPMLAANITMVVLDLAQEVTGQQFGPDVVMKAVVESIKTVMSGDQQQQAPAQDQGMLAQMQQGTGPEQEPEPAGEGPGPDNTVQHESAEPAATEQAEGAEEDGPEGEEDGMLAQMQRRRVPA